jgi:fatty acid desaturase (delta-4 desaturase)
MCPPSLAALSSSSSSSSSSPTSPSADDSIGTAVGTGDWKQQQRPLRDLQSHEVCIDGIIYDVSNFQHPGGDILYAFGGNDVTVLYKMIHPKLFLRNNNNTVLSQLRPVGTVIDFTCEYDFDTPFAMELRREVYRIVSAGIGNNNQSRRGAGHQATYGWILRACFYMAFFFYCQYRWMTHAQRSISWAILYGISKAWIGLNVQHDANHGAVSWKYPWINRILGIGADLIGGSQWIWIQQHWTHHGYTNTHNDPDTYSSEPLLIFRSDSSKRHWIQKYQVFYMMPVLMLYWTSSMLNPRILDLQLFAADGKQPLLQTNSYVQNRRAETLALRCLYILINVIMPIYHNGFSFGTLAEIWIMGASGSLMLGLLFTLSHNFEHVDQHPTTTSTATTKPAVQTDTTTESTNNTTVCWCKAQVETSSTYGGYMAGWLTGGLNYQIEHHLFPRMSSAWYPIIAPTVRRVCEKYRVRYTYYPTLWHNLLSTWRHLHAIGNNHSPKKQS